LAVALIGSSVGVANAAAGSLPGDQLYGVKRGLEEISLALSPTSAGDAELLLDFTDRRLAEAQALIEAGREDDLPAALAGYERELNRLLEREDQDDQSLSRLEAAIERHERVLNRVLGAPRPPARLPSVRWNDQAGASRSSSNAGSAPGGRAPGQLKHPRPGRAAICRRPGSTGRPAPPDVIRGPKDREDDN
jgi:hypothetical protein